MLSARHSCLDVRMAAWSGRNFVDLVDAGDPIEQARVYDREGADELTFLNVTASSDNRDTLDGCGTAG
jgi:cyclase